MSMKAGVHISAAPPSDNGSPFRGNDARRAREFHLKAERSRALTADGGAADRSENRPLPVRAAFNDAFGDLMWRPHNARNAP
jgi:hypothetical protein